MHNFRLIVAAGVLFAGLVASRSSLAYPVFGPQQYLAAPTHYVAGSQDSAPSVATNGTDFLVAWSDAGAIECARVTAGLVLLDQPSVQLALAGTAPQAFWDGQEYLVVSNGQAQRVDPATGALAAAFTLAGAPAAGRVSFAAGEILDVWQAADGSLQAGLFDLTGGEAVGNIALPSGAVADWGSAPSTGQFLVAWITTDMQVAAARVSSAGVVADATPIAIAGSAAADGGAGSPVASLNVAGSPGGYLVSWVGGKSPYAYDDSARVATTGAVADPGGVSMAGLVGYLGTPPHAAWDGSEWWVTYAEGESYTVALTLGATGAPSATVEYQGLGAIALAANPTSRLVATDFNYDISATAISPSGVGSVLDTDAGAIGIGVSTYPAPQTPICTAVSSAGYLVVWTEEPTVYGMRLALDGTPIDATPFVLGAPGGSGCGVLGDTYYFGATDLVGFNTYLGDIESIPTTGPVAITKNVVPLTSEAGTANGASPLSMACQSDRCLLLWNDGEIWGTIFGAGGAVLVPPFDVTYLGWAAPRVVATATNGSGFLVVETNNQDSPGVLAIAANGTYGSFVSLPTSYAFAAAGGTGGYLFASSLGVAWLDAAGAVVAGPEPLPLANASDAVAWEGTDYFVAQGDTSSASTVGLEIPSAPMDAGTATLATFPLFTSPAAVLVASDGAGDVIAVSTQPHGGFATPSVAARFGVPATSAPDGGPDAGPGDGGSPEGGGGLDDAETGDGAPAEGGGGSGVDASLLDASVVDGSPFGARAPTSSDATSGCGCTAAGGDAALPGAWLSIAALGLLRARRPWRRRT